MNVLGCGMIVEKGTMSKELMETLSFCPLQDSDLVMAMWAM